MSDLLNSTLSAVGQAGEAFDKVTGGRALRGAVAGKPRELLSFIPYSDSMGLTDAKDKTSGRDLTDAYGLTNKGDNSFGSHALGFAADTVLSPGNLIGGYGAFKAAPTLAKGLTQGAKALTGLDMLDGVGRKLGGLARSEGGHVGMLDPMADRLSKFTAFDNAQPTGSGAFNLVHPPASGNVRPSSSSDLASHFGPMPDHQYNQANNIIDAAKGYTSARGAQPGGISNFLRDEAGTLDLSAFMPGGNKGAGAKGGNADMAGDSLLKHLPWAGRTDISNPIRNAAAYAGPQYPGGRDKLIDAIQGYSKRWNPLAEKLMNHSNVERLASEIPEGSKFLGNGAEAVALRSPDGGVIRLAPKESAWGSAGRADIPEILQPFRSIEIPGGRGANNVGRSSSPWTVEHLPMVDPVLPDSGILDRLKEIKAGLIRNGNPDLAAEARAIERAMSNVHTGADDLGNNLEDMIRGKYLNLDPWDFHGGNVAFTGEGNVIGHDGGMIKGMPPIQRYSPKKPSPIALQTALQKGGPEAVREAMARGLELGTVGQGLSEVPGSNLNNLKASREYLDSILSQYGRVESGPPNLSGVSIGGQDAGDLFNALRADLGAPAPAKGSLFSDVLPGTNFSSAFKSIPPKSAQASLLAMLGLGGGAAAYQGAQ